jgi:CheY-like chemotaxis protein
MGGSIRVQSTPGVGSSFAFDIALTVAESGRAQDNLREVAALAPGQARRKILVVDDVPLIRTVMERLLETVGFEICTAANGREAVEAFQRFEPDFIWTDLVMPEMNGDEAARQIRQLPGGDKVRIVCMTASALVEDRARILQSGVDDVLFKPIRESVLLATMQSLLGLQYIYRDEVMEAGHAVSDEDLLESANLSYMEKSWREGFHAATLSGDTDKIQSMVQTLAATHQELALVLQTLLDELQLERLELFARLQLKPRAP